jgi:hypothetical protein
MRPIPLLLVTLMLGAGCRKDAPAPADSARAVSVAVADSSHAAPEPPPPSPTAAAADPTAALTRFLAFNSFRGAPAGPDSLAECPPPEGEGWEPDNYLGIVLPTVLGTSLVREDTSGTSATGRAAVTRVVVVDRDSLGWAGRTVLRRDTLIFPLLRAPAGWTVCGPAKTQGENYGFFEFVVTYADMVRTEINQAHWPQGTTPVSVAQHADSVIRAGRH